MGNLVSHSILTNKLNSPLLMEGNLELDALHTKHSKDIASPMKALAKNVQSK